MLVACLPSSDPRLWGMLEDTERWLRHTAGARNGTYTCQIHRISLALTETQFLPALMIIYHTATRLWRQFLLFIEQLIILVTDLLQEKLRVSVCHKTLKYHSWTSWGSGFELTARQRTESILFFFILDKSSMLEGGGSSVAGIVREHGFSASGWSRAPPIQSVSSTGRNSFSQLLLRGGTWVSQSSVCAIANCTGCWCWISV